jgi:hypothetical protein
MVWFVASFLVSQVKLRPKPDRRSKRDRRAVTRTGRRLTDPTAKEVEFRRQQQLESPRNEKDKKT